MKQSAVRVAILATAWLLVKVEFQIFSHTSSIVVLNIDMYSFLSWLVLCIGLLRRLLSRSGLCLRCSGALEFVNININIRTIQFT